MILTKSLFNSIKDFPNSKYKALLFPLPIIIFCLFLLFFRNSFADKNGDVCGGMYMIQIIWETGKVISEEAQYKNCQMGYKIFVSIIYFLILTAICMGFYLYKNTIEQNAELYNIIFNNKVKIANILEYIINNPKFSPISIQKLKKYDFEQNYHLIKLYFYEEDIEKLKDVLNIFDEYFIVLNQTRFYIKDPSSFNSIKVITKDIQDFLDKTNIKNLPKLNYSVQNGKNYIDYDNLMKYYKNLIISE